MAVKFVELWDDYRFYEELFKDNLIDAVQNYREVEFEIMKYNGRILWAEK
ncbi:hypothetical protein [Niallia sp.]|nr:hypothetical protein [Niallia sp.]